MVCNPKVEKYKQSLSNGASNHVVFHQNLQSLRNKITELEAVLCNLKQKPTCVTITEHWFTEIEVETLNLTNYRRISAYARMNKIHGGSCIFVDESLEDAAELMEITEMSLEGVFECSSIVSRSHKLIIICIYRPPHGNTDIFFNLLSDALSFCQKKIKNYRTVLTGDFNINLLEQSLLSKSFQDVLLSFNFNQTIFEPTRITKSSATLLDNLFINFINAYQGEILTTALSDHEAQILRVAGCTSPEYETIPQIMRIFSKNKVAQFKEMLGTESWANIYACKDANLAYNMFSNMFTQLFNLIFPEKTIKPSTRKHNNWITTGIKNSLKTKRSMYKSMKKGIITKDIFDRYAKILKLVICQSKKIEHINYIRTSNNPGRTIWTLVKWYRGNNAVKKECLVKNISQDSSHLSKVDILNKANKFYINLGPNLNINLNRAKENIHLHNKTIFLQPTDPMEVKTTIMRLKNKKSVGKDQIPIHLIKSVADEVAPLVSHLINLSISTGVFPDKLKVAQIVPIYKKGEKNQLSNYRPIALLNNFSKIYEKIISERLISFFEKESILSTYQNGFRKKKSTIRAIYQALDRVLDSLNLKKDTVAMYLDLSKAFDSVVPEILLSKLELYGVRGIPLKLLSSYLHSRMQRVIDSSGGVVSSSSEAEVKRGVPQGSILGPLLYIIYTNELPNITSQDTVQFADDTSIISSSSNSENMNAQIFTALGKFQHWFNANNLLLNEDKTQLIQFSYQKEWAAKQYTNRDLTLSTEKTANFLGLTVDYRLDWTSHIDSLCTTVSRSCFALSVIAQNVNIMAAIAAYHAYVHSKIRYGVIFWGGSSDVLRVFVAQKRCLRMIFNLKHRESCKPIFINEGIQTVISTYILEAVMFVKNNQDLFIDQVRNHTHDTRTRDDLLNIKSNFSFIQKNVKYCIIKTYSKIPIELRSSHSHVLKSKLKKRLIQRAYYTMQEYFDDDFSDL